jgi:hypothetical protein
MSPKRASASSGASPSAPLVNAVVVGSAVAYGIALLVMRGRMGWPPHELLASLYTVAGCLALAGPIVLARSASDEGQLGELLWMAGGLLIWVNDLAAVVRGRWQATPWATPLDQQTMGLTILAVLLAGWRCRLNGWSWSWTSLTGWALGVFWVGMAVATWVPSQLATTALR